MKEKKVRVKNIIKNERMRDFSFGINAKKRLALASF